MDSSKAYLFKQQSYKDTMGKRFFKQDSTVYKSSGLVILAYLCLVTYAYAQQPRVTNEGQHPLRHKDSKIRTTADNFDNILSATDTDLKTALETIDDAITSDAPAAPSDSCTKGRTAYDSDYFYVCIATNTWERTALASWTAGFLLLDDGASYILLSDGTSKITIR